MPRFPIMSEARKPPTMTDPGHISEAPLPATNLETVHAAREGDEQALDDLWDAHRRWVAAVLVMHKPHKADLNELLEQVSERMRGGIGAVASVEEFQALLRGVAIHVAKAATSPSKRPRQPTRGVPFRSPASDRVEAQRAAHAAKLLTRCLEELAKDHGVIAGLNADVVRVLIEAPSPMEFDRASHEVIGALQSLVPLNGGQWAIEGRELVLTLRRWRFPGVAPNDAPLPEAMRRIVPAMQERAAAFDASSPSDASTGLLVQLHAALARAGLGEEMQIGGRQVSTAGLVAGSMFSKALTFGAYTERLQSAVRGAMPRHAASQHEADRIASAWEQVQDTIAETLRKDGHADAQLEELVREAHERLAVRAADVPDYLDFRSFAMIVAREVSADAKRANTFQQALELLNNWQAESLRSVTDIGQDRPMERGSKAGVSPVRDPFAQASLGDSARDMLEELDATQAPLRVRLIRLFSQLDAAREEPEGSQRELVRLVNTLLLRLGMHLACPTCGRPSVLEYRKPQPSSRYAGGIVAAHALPGDRSKHAPESWAGLSASALISRSHPEP